MSRGRGSGRGRGYFRDQKKEDDFNEKMRLQAANPFGNLVEPEPMKFDSLFTTSPPKQQSAVTPKFPVNPERKSPASKSSPAGIQKRCFGLDYY